MAGDVISGGVEGSGVGICEHHRKIGQREGGGSEVAIGGGGNREAIK